MKSVKRLTAHVYSGKEQLVDQKQKNKQKRLIIKFVITIKTSLLCLIPGEKKKKKEKKREKKNT